MVWASKLLSAILRPPEVLNLSKKHFYKALGPTVEIEDWKNATQRKVDPDHCVPSAIADRIIGKGLLLC